MKDCNLEKMCVTYTSSIVLIPRYLIDETSLTVINLDYADEGLYSCLAWTSLDSVEKSAKLLVYGK